MVSVDWGMVGAIAGIAALGLTIYGHFVSRADRLRRDFESFERRNYWARRLKAQGGWRQRYKAALEARKNGWDSFFGGPTLSLPSFGFYLLVATVYPVVLAMVCYLVSGHSDFGGLPLMPEATTFPERVWWLALPFFIATAGFFAFDAMDNWCSEQSGRLGALRILLLLTPMPVIYFGTPAVMSLNYGAPIAAVTLVYFWFVLFTVISAAMWGFLQHLPYFRPYRGDITDNMVPFMLGISITLQLSIAYMLGWISPPMLLFFVLLPVANAIMDAISWSVTRAFVDSAAKRGITWLVFIEAVSDLAFALFCLIVLVALIANVVAVGEVMFGDTLAFTFSALFENTVKDPLGEGLIITGMLLTTFVPTCIHLWDGLRGLFAAPLAGMNEVGTALEAIEEGSDVLPDLEDRAISAIRAYSWRLVVWGVLATIILTLLGVAALWGVPEFTAFLAEVAQCATVWHGQTCSLFP